jgi:hypothetical protein
MELWNPFSLWCSGETATLRFAIRCGLSLVFSAMWCHLLIVLIALGLAAAGFNYFHFPIALHFAPQS